MRAEGKTAGQVEQVVARCQVSVEQPEQLGRDQERLSLVSDPVQNHVGAVVVIVPQSFPRGKCVNYVWFYY